MDFNIIHGGMVGFLALLATLLISLAVMIYDRTSDNSKFKIAPSKSKDKDIDGSLKAGIDDTEDVRISRLNRLEYDFKLIKEYNEENKDNNKKEQL